MVSVTGRAHVRAPPQRVFDFLDDPHNHVAITPSLADVRAIESLDNGGKRATFTYRILGLSVDGDLVEQHHDPPERMVFDLQGQLTGEIDLRVEPDGDGTEVTYDARYDLPWGPLGRVLAPLVRWYNEREVRRLLENLRSAVGTDGSE
jgi:carbon monoxide dehydrogenase subunit G